MPFLIAILVVIILLFALLFAMFDLWLFGLVILLSLTYAAVALLGNGRHAGVMYMTAIFAVIGPPKLIQIYPAIVLAISGHPGDFYWLAADSAGTPVLMKYGKPGKPSVPYSSQQAGDTHSQVYTPYDQPLKDGGWGDDTPDWSSLLNMELDYIPGPVSGVIHDPVHHCAPEAPSSGRNRETPQRHRVHGGLPPALGTGLWITPPVSVLKVCRLSSHPIDEMFGPNCSYYVYARDGQRVWPLSIRSQAFGGNVVEYGTRTWIVLEQVFGLLGALVAYFTGVAIHRIALPYFSRRGADSG